MALSKKQLMLAGGVLLLLILALVGMKSCGCGRRAAGTAAHEKSAQSKGAKTALERQIELNMAEDRGEGESGNKPPPVATTKPPASQPTPAIPAVASKEPKTALEKQIERNMAEDGAQQDGGGKRLPSHGDDARPPQPTKHERPKQIADWKPDDYQAARRENDPRLLEAVSYLGSGFPDRPKVVEILLKLLEGPPVTATAGGDPEDGPRGGGYTATALVEAVVAALDANDSPEAKHAIEQLASGTLKTCDNRSAASAALKTLLGHPTRDKEDVLYRLITAAGQAQPTDRTPNGTDAPQSTLLTMVKAMASESLRVRLANYMVAPETPKTAYDRLWTCLQDPRLENLAAQIVLYQSDRPDPAARELLEQRFVDASSVAVGRLLGVAVPKELESSMAVPTEAAAYVVAGHLWDAHFTSAVERRLAAVDTLEEGARMVRLAGTVPSSSLRQVLLRSLRMHWEEGPKAFEAAGLGDRAVPEPGFLLVAKMLARKNALAYAGEISAARGGNAHAASAKGARATALREAKQQQEQTRQRWSKFAEGLLRGTCQRFRAAALTATDAGRGADAVADPLPLKLHPDAEIGADYRVNWPDGLGGKPADLPLSTLRVRYLRIEQRARPSKVAAYCRQQLTNCEEHGTDQGAWLDAISPAREEEGLMRSTDVLINQPNKNLSNLPDQEQRLVIEILTIQCPAIAARIPTAGK